MRLFDVPTRLCLVLGWRNSILALEALGEVGWAGEAYHVADFTDSVVARVEEGGCMAQADDLYELVGGDVGQCLDFVEKAGA